MPNTVPAMKFCVAQLNYKDYQLTNVPTDNGTSLKEYPGNQEMWYLSPMVAFSNNLKSVGFSMKIGTRTGRVSGRGYILYRNSVTIPKEDPDPLSPVKSPKSSSS